MDEVGRLIDPKLLMGEANSTDPCLLADEAADSEGDDFEFVFVEEDMDLEMVEEVVEEEEEEEEKGLVVDCQYLQQEG